MMQTATLVLGLVGITAAAPTVVYPLFCLLVVGFAEVFRLR